MLSVINIFVAVAYIDWGGVRVRVLLLRKPSSRLRVRVCGRERALTCCIVHLTLLPTLHCTVFCMYGFLYVVRGRAFQGL